MTQAVTLEIDVTLAAVGTHTNTVTVGQTANQAVDALTPTGDDEIRLENNTASATIDVTEAGGELPITGMDGWSVVELALIAIAGGGALLLLARRRRSRRTA